jgi:hypothetical protein
VCRGVLPSWSHRPASGPNCWRAVEAGGRSVEQWRTLASTLPTVADVVIQAIFPWCFTPEMYVERPEFVDTLVDFVRGCPAQPVDAFLAQTAAVIAHDASAALGDIDVRTLITLARAQEPDWRKRTGRLRASLARWAA